VADVDHATRIAVRPSRKHHTVGNRHDWSAGRRTVVDTEVCASPAEHGMKPMPRERDVTTDRTWAGDEENRRAIGPPRRNTPAFRRSG
jgi:hypothetical protein